MNPEFKEIREVKLEDFTIGCTLSFRQKNLNTEPTKKELPNHD